MAQLVPLRWPGEWHDPKALSLLEGGPVNAIVVSSAPGLAQVIAEARKRGIAVINDTSIDSSVVAIKDAKWPRIPTQWRPPSGGRPQGADAGPTGAPWVDANGWRCELAAAKSPGKTIWTLAEPPEVVAGYRPPHYALAVADSAVYGGQWVVAFDSGTRKALASGGGKESWTAVTDAIRFFASHKDWLEQPVPTKLGIVSDFAGPNQFLSHELLNLLMRRQLSYRILDRARLKPESLTDLRAVLWIDQRAPDPTLTAFANDGGLLIVPASAASLISGKPAGSFEGRFDYYLSGKGKIALATKPWSNPWLLAADAHLMLGRKHDTIRMFNAGSCNVRYTHSAGRGVAHVINYTARPYGYPVSLYVAHPYRTARLSTLSGVTNEKLELKAKGDGVEVFLPEFAPYAVVEFGG
jgi:hypothetical protein